MLGISASVYVCDLRKDRVGTLVDLPFASVLPTISLADTKVQGRWLKKVLVRRVKWLSTTVTKTMYVCFIWLPCRRFHLEEGVTMTARSGVRLGSLLQAGF